MTERGERLRRAAHALLCLFPLMLAFTRAGAEISLGLIGALFLIHSMAARRWEWMRAADIRILAALWVWVLIACHFTPYASAESARGALEWGRFIIFYAAIRYWLVRSPRDLVTLSIAALGIALFVAADTAWQYATGQDFFGRPLIGDRLSGPLSTPNVGNYLLKIGLPAIGVLLYRAVDQARGGQAMGLVFALLLILALVLVSGERSIALLSLLALTAGAASIAIMVRALRRRVMAFAAAAACFLGVVASTQAIVLHRGAFLFAQLSDFWNTHYGQLFIAAFALWKEHPVFGVGIKQFVHACPPLMERSAISYCDIHPHNLYLDWLASAGGIGLVLFVAALAALIALWWRDAARAGHAAILTGFSCAVFCVLLFPVIVTQSQFSNWPAMLFWYVLAWTSCLPRAASAENGKRSS